MFLHMLPRIRLRISFLCCSFFTEGDTVFPLWSALTLADGDKDGYDPSGLLAASKNTIIFVRANYRVWYDRSETNCSSGHLGSWRDLISKVKEG